MTKEGRPEGKQFPNVRSLRFSDRDMERMAWLAEHFETSEVGAVRLALRRLAEAEGMPAPKRKARQTRPHLPAAGPPAPPEEPNR
jgi:hypothetical protein